MSIDRILQLKLISDVSDINKTTKGVMSRYKSMTTEAKKWGKAFVADEVLDGIHAVTDGLSDAWDGFRSGQKVAAQLGTTWKNLGLDGSKLQSTLDKVTASTLKLGTSDDEAVQAFNNSLQRTHDYEESLRRLTIAQDLVANGSAPNLSAAFKLIDKAATGSKLTVDKFGLTSKTAGGRVAELGRQVKGAAKNAAKLDPLRVLFNHLAEDAESFVGALSGGDVAGAVKALQSAGKAVSASLFGGTTDVKKKGKVVGVEYHEGLVSQFAGVGQKIADSIVSGLQDVASKFDLTALVSFEGLSGLAKTAIQLVQTNEGVLGTIAIAGLALGAAFSTAMFVASVFATAAAAVFGAPAFLVKGVVSVAVAASAAALGLVFRGAMFVASEFASAAAGVVGGVGASKAVLGAAAAAGGTIGALMAAGIVTAGLAAIAFIVLNAPKGYASITPDKPIYNNDHKPGTFPGYYPRNAPRNAGGTNNWKGGPSWVGEHGKELVNLPRGSQVIPHRQSMNPAGGSGGGGITINISGLIADPVAVGKQVDQVLQKYYARSGRVTAR